MDCSERHANILGLTLITLSTLLTIASAVALSSCDLKCRPGDRATTNLRDLCPDRGARR